MQHDRRAAPLVRGVAPALVSVVIPVNLRAAEWSREIVANIVSFVPVTVLTDAQIDLSSNQLAVARRT